MSDQAIRQQLVDALWLLSGVCEGSAKLLEEGVSPPAGWQNTLARRYDMVRNRAEVFTQSTHPAVRR
jgi:hypothetical protein